MLVVYAVLYAIALLCFIVAAARAVESYHRLMSAGAAFWVAVLFILACKAASNAT